MSIRSPSRFGFDEKAWKEATTPDGGGYQINLDGDWRAALRSLAEIRKALRRDRLGVFRGSR